MFGPVLHSNEYNDKVGMSREGGDGTKGTYCMLYRSNLPDVRAVLSTIIINRSSSGHNLTTMKKTTEPKDKNFQAKDKKHNTKC